MDDRTFDRVSRALAGTSSRRQAFRLIGGGIAGGALATVGLHAANAKPQTSATLTEAVTGTVAGVPSTGTLTIFEFTNQGGDLLAMGTLTLGEIVDEAVSLLVGAATGTCEILELVLGPLDLDLLGLVVHLDQVVLTIDAEAGPGNLLGNLLCAIAGLLDGGGPLGAIAGLLNNLLRALGRA
jgi:hypothetical protein